MHRTRFNYLPAIMVSSAVLFVTGCTTPEQKGWHRPARAGERVGQILGVSGREVTVGIDEACLVHPGDRLSVKRVFCEPGAGRKSMKGCEAYESGTVMISAVNAADHTATARITEGSAAADSPVFMTDSP